MSNNSNDSTNKKNPFHGLFWSPTRNGGARWSGKGECPICKAALWISVFTNTFKNHPKQPDYNATLMPREPKETKD